jgi:hypothetical protein
MARRQPASKPSWTDVKAKLASFDRLGLLGLIQDLYAAHKDNQAFLHTRFGLGADVLHPYKETLDRWLLAGCLAKPGYVRRKSQTGDLQLQKSRRRPGWTRGVDWS